MKSVRQSDRALDDDQINPDWLIEGSPEFNVRRWATSTDDRAKFFIWSATAGRFHWHYDVDEAITISEGSATITDAAGTATTLQAGDSAFIAAGTSYIWDVPEYVRKHAVFYEPLPRSVRAVLGAVRRAKSVLRRG